MAHFQECSPPSFTSDLPHTHTRAARRRFGIYKVCCPHGYCITHPPNPANLNTRSILHPCAFLHWKIYKWRTAKKYDTRCGSRCRVRIWHATSFESDKPISLEFFVCLNYVNVQRHHRNSVWNERNKFESHNITIIFSSPNCACRDLSRWMAEWYKKLYKKNEINAYTVPQNRLIKRQ
jgi:hypothetical protein